MNLKNDYQYPHPILLNETKYYKKSKLDLKLNYIVDSTTIELTYKFTVNSEFVNNLIEKEYASVYLIIESTHSMYRESIKLETINEHKTTRIDLLKIKDFFTITIVIVANYHFDNYTSKEFIDADGSYFIEKNDVIGFFPTQRYQVDNSNEQFDTISSIFTMRQAKTTNKKVRYDLDGDFVTIIMDSKRSFNNLHDLNSLGSFNHVLYTMFILTPLTTCLRELLNPKYEDYRWRNVIMESLHDLGRKDFNFTYNQAFNIAQELLDYPLTNALEELNKISWDEK